MLPRSPARFLAPLALVACIALLVVVLNAASGQHAHRVARVNHRHHRHVPRFYRVRPNDLLSHIAARFGIPVDSIRALNPLVDPRALRAGQRIQLKQ